MGNLLFIDQHREGRHAPNAAAKWACADPGKLLLRRLLTTQFRPDAAAYGLLPPTAADGWQETRLWCPLCGARRLLGRFDRAASTGGFTLRCPGCHPASAPVALSAVAFADVPGLGAALAGVSGYKAAFKRLQERIPPPLRGRVFGTFFALGGIATPIAILGAGYLLERGGLTATLYLEAASFLLLALWLLHAPALRHLSTP